MSYVCEKCQKFVDSDGFFCPYCGADHTAKLRGLSSGDTIKILLISVFLAPLGLIYFFKYFRSKDIAKRRMGYIALVITFTVSLVTMGATRYVVNQFNSLYGPKISEFEEIEKIYSY